MGFFVNERVPLHKSVAINERLAVLDIDGASEKFRVMAVYMPDVSYPDNDVDEVYAQLDEQLREACSQRRRSMLVQEATLMTQLFLDEMHSI